MKIGFDEGIVEIPPEEFIAALGQSYLEIYHDNIPTVVVGIHDLSMEHVLDCMDQFTYKFKIRLTNAEWNAVSDLFCIRP